MLGWIRPPNFTTDLRRPLGGAAVVRHPTPSNRLPVGKRETRQQDWTGVPTPHRMGAAVRKARGPNHKHSWSPAHVLEHSSCRGRKRKNKRKNNRPPVRSCSTLESERSPAHGHRKRQSPRLGLSGRGCPGGQRCSGRDGGWKGRSFDRLVPRHPPLSSTLVCIHLRSVPTVA